MRQLAFVKMQGLGNDFVVFDGLRAVLPADQLVSHAPRICDRHRGVGADGLLLVTPARAVAAHARVQVVNADGSEPEICGNGLRCVARMLVEHHPDLGAAARLSLETSTGRQVSCDLRRDASGEVASVRVAMGAPALERPRIPMQGHGRFVEQPLQAGAELVSGTAVNMGNPHLVLFFDDETQELRRLAERLGPLLEHHPAFPQRTNVGFARASSGSIALWVWERGCGLTQACGSGACAAAVGAVLTGRHPARAQPVRVDLPGGALQITVARDLSEVWMDGPAEEVFTGQLDQRSSLLR